MKKIMNIPEEKFSGCTSAFFEGALAHPNCPFDWDYCEFVFQRDGVLQNKAVEGQLTRNRIKIILHKECGKHSLLDYRWIDVDGTTYENYDIYVTSDRAEATHEVCRNFAAREIGRTSYNTFDSIDPSIPYYSREERAELNVQWAEELRNHGIMDIPHYGINPTIADDGAKGFYLNGPDGQYVTVSDGMCDFHTIGQSRFCWIDSVPIGEFADFVRSRFIGSSSEGDARYRAIWHKMTS